MEEIKLKILIIGDSNVGKSPFILRYVDKNFHDLNPTIGIDFLATTINMNGIDIKLLIFDTESQDRYRILDKSFYKGVDGIIYIYDITNKRSFEYIDYRIRDAENSNEDIKKIIVGNNMDLENKRVVSKEMLEEFCDYRNIKGFEVSTKLGINITECFEFLVKLIIGNKFEDELLKTYSEEFRYKRLYYDIKKKIILNLIYFLIKLILKIIKRKLKIIVFKITIIVFKITIIVFKITIIVTKITPLLIIIKKRRKKYSFYILKNIFLFKIFILLFRKIYSLIKLNFNYIFVLIKINYFK